MLYTTFHGKFKGGVEAERAKTPLASHDEPTPKVHLAESPVVMVLPMVVLAVAAIASGYVANPQLELFVIPVHWFSEFAVPALALEAEVLPLNRILAVVTMVLALAAMGLATMRYLKGRRPPEAVDRALAPVTEVLTQKYYIDRLYERGLVARVLYRYTGGFLEWFDQQILDSAVDTLGWLSRNIGWAIGRLQTGQTQSYAAGISLGITVILVVYLVWG
jgi:NADH-quinone oxidoreductase subunit L